jgi:hypothetical protein
MEDINRKVPTKRRKTRRRKRLVKMEMLLGTQVARMEIRRDTKTIIMTWTMTLLMMMI